MSYHLLSILFSKLLVLGTYSQNRNLPHVGDPITVDLSQLSISFLLVKLLCTSSSLRFLPRRYVVNNNRQYLFRIFFTSPLFISQCLPTTQGIDLCRQGHILSPLLSHWYDGKSYHRTQINCDLSTNFKSIYCHCMQSRPFYN